MGYSSARAHPRVGGENGAAEPLEKEGRGSSPRGRGKRTPWGEWAYALRLIPAWAGKTSRRVRRDRAVAAHPRVGGENVSGSQVGPDEHGSSPRGRGKPHLVDLEHERDGLIPAWAGKTMYRIRITAVVSGSSPRGRGKRDVCARQMPAVRLIPAWAGKTPRRLPESDERSAHPRVGGENRGRAAVSARAPGSSPRGRGKLENDAHSPGL